MDPAVVQYVSRMEAAVRASQAALARLAGENQALKAKVADLEARLKDADAANGAVRTRMSRSTASSAHIPSSAKRDMGSADEQVEQRDGVRLEASPSHAASNMPVETKRKKCTSGSHRKDQVISKVDASFAAGALSPRGRPEAPGRSEGNNEEAKGSEDDSDDELGKLIGEELARVDWSSCSSEASQLDADPHDDHGDESSADEEDASRPSSSDSETDIHNDAEFHATPSNSSKAMLRPFTDTNGVEGLDGVSAVVEKLITCTADAACANIFQGVGTSASSALAAGVASDSATPFFDFTEFVSQNDDVRNSVSFWIAVLGEYRASVIRPVAKERYVQLQTGLSRAGQVVLRLQNRLLGKIRLQRGNTQYLRALCIGPPSEWSIANAPAPSLEDRVDSENDPTDDVILDKEHSASQENFDPKPRERHLHGTHVYVLTRVLVRHMVLTSCLQSTRGFVTEVIACATTCRNVAALAALGLELTDLLAQRLIDTTPWSSVIAALRFALEVVDLKGALDLVNAAWTGFSEPKLVLLRSHDSLLSSDFRKNQFWGEILCTYSTSAPIFRHSRPIIFNSGSFEGLYEKNGEAEYCISKQVALASCFVRRMGFWRSLSELSSSASFGNECPRVHAMVQSIVAATELSPGSGMIQALKEAFRLNNHPIVRPNAFMEAVRADFEPLEWNNSGYWRTLHLLTSTILSDFDARSGGWRVGARSLGETLDYRMSGVLQLVQKAMMVLNVPLVTMDDSFRFEGSTSLYVETWRSAVSCLKACSSSETIARFVARRPEDNFTDHATTVASGLLRDLCHVTVLLSVHLMECFVMTASEVAKSKLDVAVRSVTFSSTIPRSSLECVRFLLSLPEPWGVAARAEWAHLLVTLSYKLQPDRLVTSDLLPADISEFLARQRFMYPGITINLKRRPDRMSRMYNAAQELGGLVLLRFPAVDGANHSSIIDKSIVSKNWDSTFNAQFDSNCYIDTRIVMTESERACALSHVLVWLCVSKLRSTSLSDKTAITTPSMVAAEAALSTHFTRDGELHLEKYMEQLRCVYFLSGFGRERLFYRSSDKGLFCLVLEDDAVFRFRGRRAGRDVSVSAYLGSIARALPEDCDLCYLGYAANREKQDHYLENQSSMFFVPSYVWQLHGYLLSPRGAAKLLAHLPVNEPVDNFVGRLCYNKKLKCYAIRDQLILQDKTGGAKSSQSTFRKVVDSDIAHSGGGIRIDKDVDGIQMNRKRKITKGGRT